MLRNIGLFTLLQVFLLTGLNAKSFTSLQSNEPVTIQDKFDTEGYKTIHLLASNKNKDYSTIPLKLEIILNRDTLVDYLDLNDAINDDIKTIYVYPNDSVKVNLYVLSDDAIEVDKVKGNIKISDPLLIKSGAFQNQKKFIGDYWDKDQSTIFRIVNQIKEPQIAVFKIDFNSNYAFDKLFYQINILAPDSAFYSIEGQITVTDSSFMDFSDKSIEIPQEIGVSKIGKYIVDFVPLMQNKKINGIKSISYDLKRVDD